MSGLGSVPPPADLHDTLRRALSDLADAGTKNICERYPVGGHASPPEFAEGMAKINAAYKAGKEALVVLEASQKPEPRDIHHGLDCEQAEEMRLGGFGEITRPDRVSDSEVIR